VRIAVLGNPESWYCRDIERAAVERGHTAVSVPFPRLRAHVRSDESRLLSSAHSLSEFDAVLVRTMPPGSLEQVVFRMDALNQLEQRGVTVLNPPRAVECAVDKYLTTARLCAAGLPVPETFVCEDATAALEAFELLGRDVVVKPIFGSEGRGIVRVSDPDLALRTFRTLERMQAVLYLQRFINHGGFDIRVMVLDGRVLGGMRRSSSDDFRTNVSRSARAEPWAVTEREEEWALSASRAVGTRIAGVDLLYDREGNGYVIEVNAVPGWRAFRRATGCDVAGAMIGSLERNRECEPPVPVAAARP